MLTFYFLNIAPITPIFVFFVLTWKFFISNNYFYYRIKPLSSDTLNKIKPFKKLNHTIFIKWNLNLTIMLTTSMFLFKSESVNFFFNHFSINNFKFWFLFILILFNSFLFIYFKIISRNNVPHSIDFFFALSNLSIFIPLIFISNTFYTLLFIMEVISCLLFYKFTVSKIFFLNNDNSFFLKKNKFSKTLPKEYIGMLFFQFWSTFFSTVLILVSLLNLFHVFGTSEWVYINFFMQINISTNYLNNSNYFLFILAPLFIGIFFKLGLTPLHLYKIEVYKGLPFITVFFYTTYFFLSFVFFLSYLIMFLLSSFSFFWIFFMTILFLIGAVFLASLLFDAKYVKAFFAYSTIINITLILLIILLYFNS